MVFSFFRKRKPQSNYTKQTLREIVNPPVTIRENTPVESALRMNLEGIRAVMVRKRDNTFAGLITSRDVLDFLGGGEKYRSFRSRRLKTPVRVIAEKNVVELDGDMSVREALEFFRKYGKNIHPVTENGKIIGMISRSNFLMHINKPLGILIEEVMTEKPITVREDFAINDVAKMLCLGAFKRLPVVRNDILTGLVTPYDIIFYLNKNSRLRGGLKRNKTPVKDVMNRCVATIKPENDVFDAVVLMKSKKLEFLPVVDEAELLDVITQRDVLDVIGC